MTDIVERLRERSQNLWTTDSELRNNQLFKEAADEIDRLRAALASVETYLTHGGASRSRIAQIARAALGEKA